MLVKLFQFRRRAKSRYADDKAVDDFARVAKDQGLPLDYGDDKRLTRLSKATGSGSSFFTG